MNADELDSKVKELIIARLRSAPPHMGIVIGNTETLSPKQLISEIEKNTEHGREYVELELSFLQALKEGKLYEQNGPLH